MSGLFHLTNWVVKVARIHFRDKAIGRVQGRDREDHWRANKIEEREEPDCLTLSIPLDNCSSEN